MTPEQQAAFDFHVRHSGYADVDLARAVGVPLEELWSLLAALPADVRARAARNAKAVATLTEPAIYWLHGDLSENHGAYFCALCDLFEQDTHFSTEHTREKHIARFRQSCNAFIIQSGDRLTRRGGDSDTNLVECAMRDEGWAAWELRQVRAP